MSKLNPNLYIAKFGGTSVANYQAMRNCAAIIKAEPKTRVVVVSASAGVTNLLVSLANDVLTDEQRAELLAQNWAIQMAIHEALPADGERLAQLINLQDELKRLVATPNLAKHYAIIDQVLSMGERFSSILFAAVLNEIACPAETFDVKTVLRTDNNFGEAAPDLTYIAEVTPQVLNAEVLQKVQVTQGFTGQTAEGETTTLGRGGSDFTAALLAEGLQASVCQIWTDVAGVYTTDPRITSAARPLTELSFEEAAEMATFGAKVLHPATMEPALRKNIRVFVGSSKAPQDGGTWLVKDCQDEPPYRAVARRKEQVMVTVKTPKMMYAQGFLAKVFEIIANNKLSVDLVTTSEISVSFTLDNPPNSVAARLNKECIEALQAICEVSVEHDFDLITVVGNHMQASAGVSTTILNAIQDYRVRMICFGANPHNLSFLVDAQTSDQVVTAIHQALFE